MYNFRHRGFTLVEIMVVVVVTALLSVALYMGVQPYMKRSRDTKRMSSMLQYTNILEGYEKNFDTFPSNYGSGGNPISEGYCLSELGRRTSVGGDKDMQFDALNRETSAPPIDPSGLDGIYPCDEKGSYFYSRMKYGSDNEIAIIASRMEMRPTGNYGTASELRLPSKIDGIIATHSAAIPDDAPDQLFVVSKLR